MSTSLWYGERSSGLGADEREYLGVNERVNPGADKRLSLGQGG